MAPAFVCLFMHVILSMSRGQGS